MAVARRHYGGIDLLGSRAVRVGDPVADDDAATMGWTNVLLDGLVAAPRVGSVEASGALAVDSGAYDAFNIAATGDVTVSITGSPGDHQVLLLRIKDDGASRALSWDPGSLVDSGVAALPMTTKPDKTHHVGLLYDEAAGRWVCLAADGTGY